MTLLRAEITPALLEELADKAKRLETTSRRLKTLRRKAHDSKLSAEDKPHVANDRHAKLLGEIEVAETEERRLLNRIKKIEEIHDRAKKRRRRRPEISLNPQFSESARPKRRNNYITMLLLVIILLNWSTWNEQKGRERKLEQEKLIRRTRRIALAPNTIGRQIKHESV